MKRPPIRYPKPPAYLMAMPDAVLFGTARKIEAWCAQRDKARPTLLDLAAARRLARKEGRGRRRK